MGAHARIGPGDQVTIHTAAWLEQRTGGVIEELSTDLRTWAATHEDIIDVSSDVISGPVRGGPAAGDWLLAARAWCRVRGYECPEPDFIVHVGTRLDVETLWILRAVAAHWQRIAIVGIDHDTPRVYADTCHDTGTWFDADSVDIHCPDGHGWTWRTGRELLTRDGDWTTLTMLFGPSLDAPFTGCGDCTAYRHGEREQPCPCDRTRWILCPTCGRRCDVELTPI
jgi:hypothetical protein